MAIGCGVMAGVLIEPVTWARRGGRTAQTINRLGLPTGLALVHAGRRSTTRAQAVSHLRHIPLLASAEDGLSALQ
jgi:hypothetical protein